MLRFLWSIGVVGCQAESVPDVESDSRGDLWLVHHRTRRVRWRVFGIPMPWRTH
jgi:hypothetical protein